MISTQDGAIRREADSGIQLLRMLLRSHFAHDTMKSDPDLEAGASPRAMRDPKITVSMAIDLWSSN